MIRSSSQLPMFEPESDWTPPAGPLPTIRDTDVAIDIETRDDGLSQSRGPGWVYGAGHIIGVAVAWGSEAVYVPVRHPATECRAESDVVEWLDEIVRSCRVVFHNMAYDMGWLSEAGLSWPERCDDTYAMSVMLDENHDSYRLDACCKREGLTGKNEGGLRNAADAYGLDPKSEMWKLPARHVGPYAEEDARQTLRLLRILEPRLDDQRVRDAYRLEMDLVQVVHQMRRRGIRIDETQASSVQEMMRQRREEALAEVARLWGRRCRMQDLRSPEALGALFTHAEVSVPLTKMTKKPSVTKSFLEGLRHPLGALVRSARQADEMAEKFIGNYIMGSSHRGRIHAEVHQLRSDEGGTITYRLSYSSPPLQQMPARDPVLAPPIRKIFLPERGNWWAAPDYSQQEPRLAVHFAALLNLHGAAEAVDYYATDPSADFHTMVARMTGLARSVAKIINLGLMYGMGVEKLAYSLRMTIEEAQELLATYHARVPWVKGLTDEAARLAKNRGFIRLIDGARCRFDLWQPRGRSRDDRTPAMRRPQAETLEANTAAVTGSRERELERAFSHKAMNKLVQGSAARQTKRAMLAMWRAGLLPLIQMHDELGLSVSSSSEGEMAAEIMRTVVPLRVPVKVDLEYGRTWGHAKHTWEEREAA